MVSIPCIAYMEMFEGRKKKDSWEQNIVPL